MSSPLKIQRVLVTGSSGFIGAHLVSKLIKQGYSVLGLDIHRPINLVENTQWLPCDILKADELRNIVHHYQPQAVVHLAARTDLEGKTIEEYAANVEGVKNILQAVRETPSIHRCVYTSSQLVCRVGYVPKQEEDYKPSTIYGQSKISTEKIVRENNGGKASWCIVRPTTIWGPGMNLHYKQLLYLIQKGMYFHVGRRPLYKSYGYVGNTVFQYVRLMEAPAHIVHGRLFFLADYDLLSLRAWTNAIQQELRARSIPTVPVAIAKCFAAIGDGMNLLGYKRFPFNSFRLNNILTEYQIDISKTKAVCGEIPYSVNDGIKATVAWFLGKTG